MLPKRKTLIQSFPPIANSKAKILILGTMPGKESLRKNQYYAHLQNHFWKIMFEIFGVPFTADYDVRKKLMLENKIALWDVLKHCEREGSSDNEIINEIPNELETFLKNHSSIKHIFFNGNNPPKYFEHYIGLNRRYHYRTLPSTSPAHTIGLKKKLKSWKKILKLLR